MEKKFWLEEEKRNKKKSSSAVVFRDEVGRWLLVELTYKSDFGLPGGKSERNESPIECAKREVKEEIGLDVHIERLLCIHYYYVEKFESEAIQFYFDGGILTQDQINGIKLQESEIKAIHFIEEKNVKDKFYMSMKLRFPYLKKALKTKTTQYFETKI